MKKESIMAQKSIVKLSTILFFCGSLALSSCKKAEGPAGPAGPAGANGKDGNANVKSQTSTNLNWVFNTATKNFETNISVAAITQDIVDKGAVLVYLQDGSTSSQLPVSSMWDAATIVFFDFEYSAGNVKVMFHNSDLDNSIVPQSTLKFKIVAMTASAKAANVNPQSYQAVPVASGLQN